ncbi:MAG: PQ-loop domain-containing transporter [Patescibacteria group bacterium]
MLDGFRRRFGIKRHNHPIDLLAEANGLLSGIALYPQVFKALATRQVSDLSPTTFFIIFTTNIIWFAYAIHRRALPVIVASILNGIASGVLIAFFFLYD